MESPLIRLVLGNSQVEHSTRYFFDNAKRNDGPNTFVIQRTLIGKGYFKDTLGQEHSVTRGRAMLFVHGEKSSYGYHPEHEGEYALEFLSMRGKPMQGIFDMIRERLGSVIELPDDSESYLLFKELMRRFSSGGFRDRFHESSMLYEFLMAVMRQQTSPLSNPVDYLHESILNRYQEPITLNEILDQTSLSREHLVRLYRARYEQSPGKFLQQLRMDTAKDLLTTTGTAVEFIAGRCGYTDAGTFARAFRRVFGESPREYRARGSGRLSE